MHSKLTPEQKRKIDRRHYPVRPHIGVGGVITWKDNVVLIKRKFNPDAGKWSIPGGHLKVGERLAEGARRESEEETGLKLKIKGLAEIIERVDRDDEGKIEYHYILIDYFLEIVNHENNGAKPTPEAQDDAEDARLVPIHELKNYNLTYTVVELFKKIGFM